MHIRPYRLSDRTALRRLALDTSDRGRPGPAPLNDPELSADLLTRYYTDLEPAATFVAEDKGAVVGYLTGCLDSRRHARALAWRVVPTAFAKAMARGSFFRPGAGLWLRAFFANRRLIQERRRCLGDYPAHIHINLADGARGRGAGGQLLAAFFDLARGAGAGGVHLGMRADNDKARAFFEKQGFHEADRVRILAPRDGALATQEVALLVRRLP